MSQGDFNNKVVLVTGAASGIGEAIAKAFLEQGAEVIVVDLDISALNNCFDSYDLAKSLQQDLTVANAAATIADWVARNGGRLDILVNNAGRALHSEIGTTTDELWQTAAQRQRCRPNHKPWVDNVGYGWSKSICLRDY
jgi:NAD(P)-dependent dehydrogenase (short-subunit alcohol dehydrogenase family)